MIIYLVQYIIDLMNRMATKNGADRNTNPAAIVEGKNKLDLSKNRLAFGAYAEVWIGTDNTMNTRSIPEISLGPSNDDG